MFDPRDSIFWRSAIRSGLMDAEKLSACWDAIEPAKRDQPERIEHRLARRAVQAGWVTLWQAQQLLAGRTVGYMVDRYRLLEMIGQGGMGRVYLAEDTRLDRRVAVKILTPERLSNPRALERFRREARMGARLEHENLVRTYDFGEAGGRHFLVMEYIEGKSIGALMDERGPVPPATAARLVRQVALGLEHAHRKGLIHRDVNPFNIMVTHDGTAKLADMGLAVIRDEQDRITRDGATVGTFDYTAPEQAMDSRAADTRSDIYSLGCTMYHMCSGHVPFPGPSLPEKVLGHQIIDPTPLSRRIPGFPDGLSEVVRRMMRKTPDERYATPLEVAVALAPYQGGYDGDGAFGVRPTTHHPLEVGRTQPPGVSPNRHGPEHADAPGRPALRGAPARAATEGGAHAADSAASLLTPDEYDAAVDIPLLIPDVDPTLPSSGEHSRPELDPSPASRRWADLAAATAGWPIRVRRWFRSRWQ